jgi:hypothetical protein
MRLLPAHNLHPLLGCLQELTFEVGPSAEAKQLKVALYEVTPGEAGTDEFIGSGRWGPAVALHANPCRLYFAASGRPILSFHSILTLPCRTAATP